jgi:CRP-like cAMP-binding protein
LEGHYQEVKSCIDLYHLKPSQMNQDKETLVHFIQAVFPMPPQQCERIVNYFKEKDFQKNEFLLKEGRPCNEYHFLVNGFMRAYIHNVEGNDVTTAFYAPRQVVCELFSFFKRIPSRENIQALTDCSTLYITFDELQYVFHTLPEFREFGRSILVNAYAQLKQRMLSMLQETAEERYSHLLKMNPDIFQHAPLKNIATYLGVTDTSLSRIRKEFLKNQQA